jgi:hypothetical protein
VYLSRLSRAFVCAVLLSAASAAAYAQEKVEVKLAGAADGEKLKAEIVSPAEKKQ